MTERIAVGDLVQVVGTHCVLSQRYLGKIFTVRSLMVDHPLGLKCSGCHRTVHGMLVAESDSYELYSYLKRIPPLSELEGVKTDEPIKEPA